LHCLVQDGAAVNPQQVTTEYLQEVTFDDDVGQENSWMNDVPVETEVTEGRGVNTRDEAQGTRMEVNLGVVDAVTEISSITEAETGSMVTIVNALFSKKKFVMSDADMDPASKLAKFVMERMTNVRDDADRLSRYRGLQGRLRKAIDTKRNTAVNGIKTAFMSEYFFFGLEYCSIGGAKLCFFILDLRLKNALPPLEELVQLRRNHAVMKVFCEHFLPCVVGKVRWKTNCCSSKVGDIATVTDEAFVLLVLENIWEIWSQKDVDDWVAVTTAKY
jgi:hypothetical protein